MPFLVTYAGVGGPRTAGLAGGLQTFYILACFPPYDPAALGARLAGLATGMVLMAVAEVWLLPDFPPGRYADRLARAAALASGALRALAADTGAGTAGDALVRARLAQVIAEASYVQYATERGAPDTEHPAETDFQAIMLAGDRALTMGQILVDPVPAGRAGGLAAQLRDAAHHLRLTALSLTYDLHSGKPRPAPVEPPDRNVPTDRTVIADVCAASGGRAPDPLLYYAVDAAIWLASLQRVVTAIRPATEGRTAGPG